MTAVYETTVLEMTYRLEVTQDRPGSRWLTGKLYLEGEPLEGTIYGSTGRLGEGFGGMCGFVERNVLKLPGLGLKADWRKVAVTK